MIIGDGVTEGEAEDVAVKGGQGDKLGLAETDGDGVTLTDGTGSVSSFCAKISGGTSEVIKCGSDERLGAGSCSAD